MLKWHMPATDMKQQELAKAEMKRLEREWEEKDKRTTSLLDKEKELLKK